jgi:hypothetical protein
MDIVDGVKSFHNQLIVKEENSINCYRIVVFAVE